MDRIPLVQLSPIHNNHEYLHLALLQLSSATVKLCKQYALHTSNREAHRTRPSKHNSAPFWIGTIASLAYNKTMTHWHAD